MTTNTQESVLDINASTSGIIAEGQCVCVYKWESQEAVLDINASTNAVKDSDGGQCVCIYKW